MTSFSPESVNLSSLPFLLYEFHSDLPKCAGIYMVLCPENKVIYVGSSKNIKERWRYHHRHRELEKLNGLRIVWMQISDISLMRSTETALILFLRPQLNERIPNLNNKPNKKLAELRLRANLTQGELAKAVGISDQTISNWESGVYTPRTTLKQTSNLCKALQCTLDDLIAATEEEEDFN